MGLTSKLIKNSAMQIVLAKLIKGVDGQPSGFLNLLKSASLHVGRFLRRFLLAVQNVSKDTYSSFGDEVGARVSVAIN